MPNEKDPKTITIVVNGTPHDWPKGEITLRGGGRAGRPRLRRSTPRSRTR